MCSQTLLIQFLLISTAQCRSCSVLLHQNSNTAHQQQQQTKKQNEAGRKFMLQASMKVHCPLTVDTV